MAHADTQILNRVAARLVSMTTVDDADVHVEHIWDFTNAALPAIDCTIVGNEVVGDDEDVTLGEMLRVQAALVVSCYEKQSTSVGNQLREMASEVISKLIPSATDTTLGDLVSEIDVVGYELDVSSEEEKPIGRLTLTFAVMYRVLIHDWETIQS